MKAAIFAISVALLSAMPATAETALTPTGAAAEGVRIVVPARNIARGEVISDSDLTYVTVAARRNFPGAATSLDQLDGKQARRFLHLGEPVQAGDVRAPILVAKGSTVTVTFRAPGITLTAAGKAMSEGGLNEPVTVLNLVSYRQITATVTGPGTAAAGDISNTVSSDSAPAQLAAAQP